MSNKINLTSPFWVSLRDVNATKAIYHQWKILENSGCIENFRIAASKQDGLREGWFFSDSDAYKWLDAAARIYSATSSPALKKLMDDFVTLLTDAQDNDGYLYTYNQIHFPNSRWENLLIEHEFYCLGHLIEACISHHQVIGDQRSLAIAQKSADLLVRNFKSSSLIKLDGHEEVEIALFRLYAATGNREYKDLASAMLDRRGKLQPFPLFLISQFSHVKARKRFVEEYRRKYLSKNPSFVPRKVPEGNFTKTQKYSHIRWLFSALTGKYFQMHRPIETQTIPVGHCVRFGYLNTAVAMRSRLTSDYSLIPTLEKSWERMVTRRMYVTGGLGSVPGLEGFGRDYELDPEYAYAETCAALASILWCWEMAQVTNDAKYSDLLEWQLYNAALPGMGLNGKSYLYNNPLVNNQGVSRREWFLIPCCPSKLSRILASLEDYIYSADEKNLWIHQYIGNQGTLSGEKSPKNQNRQWRVTIHSCLPLTGMVQILINKVFASNATVHIRIPSWAGNVSIKINNREYAFKRERKHFPPTASGYDPRYSYFLPIARKWADGDVLEMWFDLPLRFRRASAKVRGHKGKIAVSCGPLLYCLESCDNNDLDIFTAVLDSTSAQRDFSPDLLGGTPIIRARTINDQSLTLIPYYLWANRGQSQMTVWIAST